MGVLSYQRHRGILCAELVISEQGSMLAYAVTEWGETGKSNDWCSSWVLVLGLQGPMSRVDMITRTQT
jgi:hypothetical protein